MVMKLDNKEIIRHHSSQYRVYTDIDMSTNEVVTTVDVDDACIDTHRIDASARLDGVEDVERETELRELAEASHRYVKHRIENGHYDVPRQNSESGDVLTGEVSDVIPDITGGPRDSAFPRLGDEPSVSHQCGDGDENPLQDADPSDTLDISPDDWEGVEDDVIEVLEEPLEELPDVDDTDEGAKHSATGAADAFFDWSKQQDFHAGLWRREQGEWRPAGSSKSRDIQREFGESMWKGLIDDCQAMLAQIPDSRGPSTAALVAGEDSLVMVHDNRRATIAVIRNKMLGYVLSNGRESCEQYLDPS